MNRLLQIVGNPSTQDQVPLHLNQDVNLYVLELADLDARVAFSLKAGRQTYINNFEGAVDITGLATLAERDALDIVGPALHRHPVQD